MVFRIKVAEENALLRFDFYAAVERYCEEEKQKEPSFEEKLNIIIRKKISKIRNSTINHKTDVLGFILKSGDKNTDLNLVDDYIDVPWYYSLLAKNENIMKEANRRRCLYTVLPLYDDIVSLIRDFCFRKLKNEKLILEKLAKPDDKFFSYEEYNYDNSLKLEKIRCNLKDYDLRFRRWYMYDAIDFTFLSERTYIPLNFVDEFVDKPWDWKRLSENVRIVREFKKRDCVYKMFNQLGFDEYVVDLISDFSFYKLNNRKLIWEKLKI